MQGKNEQAKLESLEQVLEQPMISTMVMFIFSVIAAIIFFVIGGSIAEVSGQQTTLLGLSIKAGGALGGFVIIFLLLRTVFREARTQAAETKALTRQFLLTLDPTDGFNVRDPALVCRYKIFDRDTTEWSEWQTTNFTADKGSLKIGIKETDPLDTVDIMLADAHNHVWLPEDQITFGVTQVQLKLSPPS